MAHPVTEWYRWAVGEVLAEKRQKIGRGATLRATSDDTAQATALAVGIAEGIETALGIEPAVMGAMR